MVVAGVFSVIFCMKGTIPLHKKSSLKSIQAVLLERASDLLYRMVVTPTVLRTYQNTEDIHFIKVQLRTVFFLLGAFISYHLLICPYKMEFE